MKRLGRGRNERGFTLVGFLVTAFTLFPVCLAAVLVLYQYMESNKLNQSSPAAVAAQLRMSPVEGTVYSQIYATYNNSSAVTTAPVDDSHLSHILTGEDARGIDSPAILPTLKFTQ
jgi:hypothetical protein